MPSKFNRFGILCVTSLLLCAFSCDQHNPNSSPSTTTNQEKQPEELPQQEQSKIQQDQILHQNNRKAYCALKYSELNPPEKEEESNDEIEKRAMKFEKSHKLQEAIWEYGKNKKFDDERERVTQELTQILTEGDYEVVERDIGGTHPKTLLEFPLEDGKKIRGVFKATDWFPEVATYQVDQLLRLDIVPMSVRRTVKTKKGLKDGNIQYWVSGTRDGTPDDINVEGLTRMKILDFLIGNSDRSLYRNFLYWNKQKRLIAVDHEVGFKSVSCGELEDIQTYIEHDEELASRFKDLDLKDVKSILKKQKIKSKNFALILRRFKDLKK